MLKAFKVFICINVIWLTLCLPSLSASNLQVAKILSAYEISISKISKPVLSNEKLQYESFFFRVSPILTCAKEGCDGNSVANLNSVAAAYLAEVNNVLERDIENIKQYLNARNSQFLSTDASLKKICLTNTNSISCKEAQLARKKVQLQNEMIKQDFIGKQSQLSQQILDNTTRIKTWQTEISEQLSAINRQRAKDAAYRLQMEDYEMQKEMLRRRRELNDRLYFGGY